MKNDTKNPKPNESKSQDPFLAEMLAEFEQYLKLMIETIELYKKSRGIK